MSPETVEHVLMALRAELRALEIASADEMRRVGTATRDEVLEIEQRVIQNTERMREVLRRIARLERLARGLTW